MKKIQKMWWIVLMAGGLWAQTLHLPDGSQVCFMIQQKQARTSHTPRVYYKNGFVENAARFIDTRKIVVRFQEDIDETGLIKFAKRYRLTLMKNIGGVGLYLFRIDSAEEIITLCNRINANEPVSYARPSWHRPRQLR